MDEKELKELEELLTGAEKDLDEVKVEDAKAKIAAAKQMAKRPIGGGNNGIPKK